MNPQEAKDALARMDTWQGMSNDEAHELLRQSLTFIASMKTQYALRYIPSGTEEFDTGCWYSTRWEACDQLTAVLEDDPLVARIVRQQVSPLETVTTAARGGVV